MMRIVTPILAACGLASISLAAPSTPLSDQLRDHSDRQQQIRAQTANVADQLDTIIAEFERNGLGNGKDVATLKSLRGVLGQLDTGQMQQVVQLLQHAAADSSGKLAAAEQAFTLQQDILGQFRKLLIDYQRQQGLATLAQRVEELSQRQAANLRAAVDLATTNATANKADTHKAAAALAAMQAQQSEQTDIAGEVAAAMATARLMLSDTGGEEAARLAKAMSDPAAAAAVDNSKSAAADLQTSNLFRAATGEKTSRDSLRALAGMLAPPKNALDVKKEQLAALDQIKQQQQDLEQQTAEKPEHPDPRDPAQSMQPLAREQAAAVDQTDDAERKLANVSPKTAAALDHAEKEMQDARSNLQMQSRRGAMAEQAKATSDLEDARQQLHGEIAKAEQQNASATTAPASPPDPEAAARQLAAQIKQLRQQQQNATADTHANPSAARQQSDQQQQLANTAQDLQQQAAPTDEKTADAIGQAQLQMQQAADALKRGKADNAAQKQRSADDALARAQSAAEQKASAMAQAKEELKDLQKAQQQIGELIQKQAELAATDPNAPDQKALAAKTNDTPAALPDAAKSAAAPLKDAGGQMNQAANKIENKATPDARVAQANAIANLAEAAAKVNSAIEQTQAKLGQSPGESAAAQKALAKATDELQQAQADLAKPDASGKSEAAAAHLKAAAQQAAKALAENHDAQQKSAVQQAIGEMTKSADHNAQQNNPEAKHDADQAAAALAQAKLEMPDLAQQASIPQRNTQKQLPAEVATADQPNGDLNRPGEDSGPRNALATGHSFIQLPPRDRAALEQSQSEKYPQEYGPLVEQYLKNLADTPSK